MIFDTFFLTIFQIKALKECNRHTHLVLPLISVFNLFNNKTTSPSFLRADSQRGAAELSIARRKRGRVI